MLSKYRRWWRDAVIYQVYVRSFLDSTGDGIGDLAGVRAGLPYLKKLGVDGIWLSPFYPSPQHDHGYDVADYCDVDPLFGDLAEFDLLVAAARRLGVKVLLDVVPNHCSSEHPWFKEALAAAPGSAARARFHFADGRGTDGCEPPNNWHSMFGGPAWTRVVESDGRPGQWYLHMFAPEQPDWNWRVPDVAAEFDRVLRFWLDRGVDGFRIDVAAGLFKHPGLPDSDDPEADARTRDSVNPLAWNQPEVHDVWRHWRAVCEEYTARDGHERLLVGEVSVPSAREHAKYVRSDELHQAFFFDLLSAPWNADAFRKVISEAMQDIAGTGSTVTWVLNNHDQVRTVTRYGEPATGGGLGAARARAAALLMLALPGAAYIYQGEELGLPEVVDLPDDVLTDPIFRRTGSRARIRDGCRVPLPWSGQASPSASPPAPRAPGRGCRSRRTSPSTPPTVPSPTPAPSGTCTATASNSAPRCPSWARECCAGWTPHRASSPSPGATASSAPSTSVRRPHPRRSPAPPAVQRPVPDRGAARLDGRVVDQRPLTTVTDR